MTEVKLTKNELRLQEGRLKQLQHYLPTLQLKKGLLQIEVNEARLSIERLRDALKIEEERVSTFLPLFSDVEAIDLKEAAVTLVVNKRIENIAGVEIPYFEGVEFAPFDYLLFEAPAWTDAAVRGLRRAASAKAEVEVAEEKKRALEKELREVSIRVNLFEKILIPRARQNIRKIKVFLGDQQLAAVSQAKVAKSKKKKRVEEACGSM